MTRLAQSGMPRSATQPAVLRVIFLAVTCVCLSLTAVAQGRGGGGGPGGGGPGGGGMSRGPFGGNMGSSPPPGSRPNGSNPTESTMGGGLQLGPPGRWWDDRKFVQGIGIDSRQQQRMDSIFSDNKGTLVKLYKNLQHEESQLGKTVRAKDLDENQIFQQIDRVSQARAELEKANAHMLLMIRKEMSAEQTARLDEHRPSE